MCDDFTRIFVFILIKIHNAWLIDASTKNNELGFSITLNNVVCT